MITYPTGSDRSYVTLQVAEYDIESENTEYKQLWRSDFLKAISAFANTGGGVLHIGLDDSGKPVGLRNTKNLLEDIPNIIRNRLGIVPSIELGEEDGEQVISITVTKSSVPISFNGRFYVRSGSTVQELAGGKLAEFLLEALNYSWDEQIEEDATVADLCTDTMEEFKRLAQGRLPSIAKESNFTTILQKLGLLKNGKLTKAAVLLFAKDPQKHCLQAVVKMGKFQSPTVIQTTDIVQGNLFNQLGTTMEILQTKYLLRNISFEGLHRLDTLEYPYEALREAIINAIIHRDYTKPVQTQIRIYPDRLVVRNPGKLSSEVPAEKLKTEHDSFLRNKLIASVFYYAGFIEAWGSGMGKILKECRKQGLPEPDFAEENGIMVVTLYKDICDEGYLKKLNLNQRQIAAVMYVRSNGKITNNDYRKINSVSRSTSVRDLAELVSMEIFNQTGSGKEISYLLSNTLETEQNASTHLRPIRPIYSPSEPGAEDRMSKAEESASIAKAGDSVVEQEDKALTALGVDPVADRIADQATNQATDQVTPQDTPHVTPQDTDQDTDQVPGHIIGLLRVIINEMASSDIMKVMGLSHKPSFRYRYLNPAIGLNLIEMTLPEKPTSRNQKYRLTNSGLRMQKKLKAEK